MPRAQQTREIISAKTLPTDFESLVRMHPPAAIHDEVACRNAQEMIDALTCIAKPSPGQLHYLDTLTILFEAYEEEAHAFDASKIGPLDVLKVLMEEHGMNASDLGRLLGERSLGPKVLSGARELSKSHIRALVSHFHVSADLFI